MFFPIQYNGELLLNRTEDFNMDRYLQQIEKEFQISNNPFSNKKENIFPLPWVNLGLRYGYSLNDEHATINIKYSISLFELNLFFVLCTGLAIFVFIAQHLGFAILLLGFAIFYYWFALSTVSHGIKHLFTRDNQMCHAMEEPGLWQKQQIWMKNPTLCSACGEPKNPYSKHCVNCGVADNTIKKTKDDNTSPTDSSNEIKYHFNRNKDA